MYCCLCASIIIIVIILISTLSEFGKYIDENFDGDRNEIFTNIYDSVVTSAAKGKTTDSFTIMCIRSPDPNGARKNYYGDDNSYSCDNYDGYQRWWIGQIKKTGGEVIPNNNHQSEQIKMRVIEKIQSAFPDSNITKSYKNCCDIYNITW
jgi:glucan phosphoethanolaminetransferase (alkaline phosphatase superfamily)